MAVAGIQLSINTDELRSLRDNIKAFFPKADAADVLGDAIEKAIYPMYQRLREVTPVGPTGNLKRAVAQKVVKYRNTGVAVGIVGYQRAGAGASASAAGGSVRAGPDRGFHQWWLEFGTQVRRVGKYSNTPYQRTSPTRPFTRVRNGRQETVRGKGVVHWVSGQNAYIASSFNRLGDFDMVPTPRPPRGGPGHRVQTEPAYPRAFFKKSKTPIVIPAMPAGGTSGRPPVLTAFNDTQSRVAEYLQRELSLSLGEAWAALRVRDSGSITGTDTLGPG
jgi:hypothetical protein